MKLSARRWSPEKTCGSPPMDLISAACAIGCWLACWAGGPWAPGALGGLPPKPPDPPEGPSPLGLSGGPPDLPSSWAVEYYLRLALSLELMLCAVPVVITAVKLPVPVFPLAGPFPLELEPSPPWVTGWVSAGCWIVIEIVAMVDNLGKIGKSFVCFGRETVFLLGVSSLGMAICLICLLIWRCQVCSASSLLSNLLSCSAGCSSLSDSGFSLISKLLTLGKGCYNLGNPIFELCKIWCQTLLYRQTGIVYLFITLSSLSQNSWIGYILVPVGLGPLYAIWVFSLVSSICSFIKSLS